MTKIGGQMLELLCFFMPSAYTLEAIYTTLNCLLRGLRKQGYGVSDDTTVSRSKKYQTIRGCWPHPLWAYEHLRDGRRGGERRLVCGNG